MAKKDFSQYTNPPPRGPYQLKDYAVVTNFTPYGAQSKGSLIHRGQMGFVVGYRNVPGSYSKYLLEFEDGDRDAYMPSVLKGPFSDKSIAQTYVDNPKKQIIPSELAVREGKKTLKDEWETKPKVEAKLKDFVVNELYFKWLDTPELVNKLPGILSDNNSVFFILAKLEDFPNILLFREHHKSTRKLRGGNVQQKGYGIILPTEEGLKKMITTNHIYPNDLATSFEINSILKPGSNYWRSIPGPYLKLYQKAFKRFKQVKDMEEKLPELAGLF